MNDLSTTAVGVAATLGIAFAATLFQRSERLRSLTFTAWVCAFICAAMFFPQAFVRCGTFEYRRLFTPLIWVIMFGMGTTLTFDDFTRIAKMPWGVMVGTACHYTVMPTMGWAFARLFGLEAEIGLGLILIGCCPSGASSNVLNYLAGVNVPLSVTMTAFSTLASPLATPLALKLIAGQTVDIPLRPMVLEIAGMVVLPVLVGLLVNRFLPALARWLGGWLPTVSMLCICVIIGVTVGMSRDHLLSAGLALLGASACHNAAGYFFGYWGARAMGLDRRDSRTVAIEVGIQNGGMATGLALNVFGNPLVALASAVFGPWSAIAGSALASYWHARPTESIVSSEPN